MANNTTNIIRLNIKKYRLHKNLTQDKLSEQAGISCDYLSEIERGKRIPSLKRLIMIADALEMELWQLVKP